MMCSLPVRHPPCTCGCTTLLSVQRPCFWLLFVFLYPICNLSCMRHTPRNITNGTLLLAEGTVRAGASFDRHPGQSRIEARPWDRSGGLLSQLAKLQGEVRVDGISIAILGSMKRCPTVLTTYSYAHIAHANISGRQDSLGCDQAIARARLCASLSFPP